MTPTELNRCIPYWQDDPEELPEGIPPVTRPDVPVAGYNSSSFNPFAVDELGLYNFPGCFSERL